MKFLLLFLVPIAVAASAAEAPPPAPPAQPAAAPEARAAAPSLPEGKERPRQGWLLLVAGLTFAGWVAHRRLSYL